ncbi:hypothetical protein T439DRAFT_327758 [Meredithblackwellia eburnea MCA 4105]
MRPTSPSGGRFNPGLRFPSSLTRRGEGVCLTFFRNEPYEMAPRIPKNLSGSKPKGKGKSKAIPIDFSSPQAAQATAPDLDADSWLEEGSKQESNGERYQFGAKSVRHYENAIVCYSLSATLSPSFSAYYNGGRVMYHLATEHDSNPLSNLRRAAQVYETALEYESGRQRVNVVDAKFNLAECWIGMAEAFDEGAAEAEGDVEEAEIVGLLGKARALLVEVAELQKAEVDSFLRRPRVGEPQEGEEDVGMNEDVVGEEEEGETEQVTVEAHERITPGQVIETLLELVSIDQSLFQRSSSAAIPPETIFESISATLSQVSALQSLEPDQEQDRAIEIVRLSIASTLSSSLPLSSPLYISLSDISARYSSLLTATSHKPTPELHSLYGDFLLSLPSSSTTPSSLHLALQHYESSLSLLTSKLNPPKDVKQHSVPILVSANLASQTTAWLALHHLGETRALQEALSKAVQGAGYLFPDAALDKSSMSLRRPRTVGGESRNDWPSRVAGKASLLAFVRVRLRALANAPGLGVELGSMSTKDIERFVEEIRGDIAWYVGEEDAWRAIMALIG